MSTNEKLIETIIECAQMLNDAPIPENDRMLATEEGIMHSDGRFTPWEDV